MDFTQLLVPPGLGLVAGPRTQETSTAPSTANGATVLAPTSFDNTPIKAEPFSSNGEMESLSPPPSANSATKVTLLVALQYVRGGIHGVTTTSRPYKVICAQDSMVFEEFLELLQEKFVVGRDQMVGVQLEAGEAEFEVDVDDEDSWNYVLQRGVNNISTGKPLKLKVFVEDLPTPPKTVTSKEAEELILLAAAAAKKAPKDRSTEENYLLLKPNSTKATTEPDISSIETIAKSLAQESGALGKLSLASLGLRSAKAGAAPETVSIEQLLKNAVAKSESNSAQQTTNDSPRKISLSDLKAKLEREKSIARDSQESRDREKQRDRDRRHRRDDMEYETDRDFLRGGDSYRPSGSRYRDNRDRSESRDRRRSHRDSSYRDSSRHGRHRDSRSLSPKRRGGGLYSEQLYMEMENKKKKFLDHINKAAAYNVDSMYGMGRDLVSIPARARPSPGIVPHVPISLPPPPAPRSFYSNPIGGWPQYPSQRPMNPNNSNYNNNGGRSSKSPKSVAYIATRASNSGGDWVKYQLRNTGGPDVKVRMRDAGNFGAEWREVLGPLADNPVDAGGNRLSIKKSPGLIMFFFRTRPVTQGISGFGCDVRGEVSMTFSVDGFEPGSFHYTNWSNFETGELFLTVRFTIQPGAGYFLRGFSGNQRDGEVEWNTANNPEASHVSYNCGNGFRITGPNGANLQRLTGHLLSAVKSGKNNSKMQVTFSIGDKDNCWDLLPFLQKHGAIKLDSLSSYHSPHQINFPTTSATEVPLKNSTPAVNGAENGFGEANSEGYQ